MEGLEGFELAPYFERRVINDPERWRVLPHVADTVNDPEETMTQTDGKVRYWRYVPEGEARDITSGSWLPRMERCSTPTRIQGTPEGKGGGSLRFEYYPDTDSLYIDLNPARKRKPGGMQEVVGRGDRDIVIDVDGDGVPVGIDIDSFASEIVDITKLEAEGPVFGLARTKIPKDG